MQIIIIVHLFKIYFHSNFLALFYMAIGQFYCVISLCTVSAYLSIIFYNLGLMVRPDKPLHPRAASILSDETGGISGGHFNAPHL